MDDLRRDVSEAFEKGQAELGDLTGARERMVRRALVARASEGGNRMPLAAGVAAIVIAALVIATFVYVRSGNQISHGGPFLTPTPTPTAAPATPTASPDATPSPSPLPSGSPAATPPQNVVAGLHCKLPVYLPGQRGSGEFISFPDGAVAPDPSSNVGAPGTSTGGSDPGDWFGLTYDTPMKRWLPVPYTWISPDGSLYAYAKDPSRHQNQNELIEVNALTDTSGVVQPLAPVNGAWQVIAVSQDHIYAISSQAQGIFVVPISGPWNNENYVNNGFWTAASGFYWFGSVTPDGGAVLRVDSRDPAKRVAWFHKSVSAQIIGFDGSGSPVIWTGSDLWIASAPGVATRIGSKPPLAMPSPPIGTAPLYGSQSPVSDSHGLWFSTTDGIYLYDGAQTTKVSDVVAQVAGTCS